LVEPLAPDAGQEHAPAAETDELLLKLRAEARLRCKQQDNESKYANDPWLFLIECVWTLDQITGKIRKFPNHPYLQYLTEEWMNNRLMAVAKSRRMMVTWWAVALHYWLVRFRPGTTIAFVSRKEGRNISEGSAELVNRAKFIHDHLPGTLSAAPVDYKFCRLSIPSSYSEIIGIGQGPDQLRQLTVTAIFADELAFWEQARETFIASRPTIEGGGRFLGVSTANPGFFQQIVEDTFNLQ